MQIQFYLPLHVYQVSKTDLLVLWCCSFNELRRSWLSCLVFPGLPDAVESSTSGVLSLHRETTLIIGFDLAVTLSSPTSSCVLFDITWRQLVELKWLMLKRHKRCFHSSRVKFPLVSMSANWFLVSMYLIWIFGSKLFDRTTNQEQLNGFWKHVCWSLLRCLQTHTTKLPDGKSWRLSEQNQHCPNHWSVLEIAFVFELCEVLNELHVGSNTSLPRAFGSGTLCWTRRKSSWGRRRWAHNLWGGGSRQESPYPSGGVHRVATALTVVDEVQEEVHEVKDEWVDEDVEGNGGLKVEEIRSSCDDHEMTRTSETWATRCGVHSWMCGRKQNKTKQTKGLHTL